MVGGSDGDVVGAARDVVLAPLHHQRVLPLVLQLVADVVHPVPQMFDQDLLAGHLRAVHPDQEHVPPWGRSGSKVKDGTCTKTLNRSKHNPKAIGLLGSPQRTCFAAVDAEAVLLAHVGLAEPHALGHHLGGV